MVPMAMQVTEMGASEGCPVIGQIGGCVASWGQPHLAGNGADFLLVLNSRTLEEPMTEAKQMTTGNPLVQLHTRPVDFPPPRESAASQYRVGLLRFESDRVLVFMGAFFECSSRMNGKPSSPVLRGLGASNGARPLDHVESRWVKLSGNGCVYQTRGQLLRQPKR